MLLRLCAVLVLVILGASPSGAEDAPRLPAPTSVGWQPPETSAYRDLPTNTQSLWWFEGGLLRWKIKEAPVPFPVSSLETLTTSLFGPPSAQPVPQSGLTFERGVGGRLSVGSWLKEEGPLGFEAGGLFLFQQTPVLTLVPALPASLFTSNLPLLNVPVATLLPNLPRNLLPTLLGTNPLLLGDLLRSLRAGVTFEEESALYGAEVNGLLRIRADERVEFVGLAGFRFLALSESAVIRNPATDMFFGQLSQPNSSLANRFITENRFTGGQVGGRLTLNLHQLWFTIGGKIALGTTVETRDVAGSFIDSLGQGLSTSSLLGSLTTQGGVRERRTTSEFAVVNELNARVGLQLWRGLGAWVGYDFLYWSRVARTGDQFDQLLNLGSLLNRNNQREIAGQDFYAHGFSFGIELNY